MLSRAARLALMTRVALARSLVVATSAALPLGLATAAAWAAADETQARIDEAAAAIVRGNTQQAVAAYTEALKDNGLSSDRRAIVLNDRAVANVRLGLTRQAIEDFNRAAQLFPEYAAIYNNRGNLLLALGLAKEALKDFDRALVLAPSYVAALNNRAGAQMKLGNHAEAMRDFTRAIQLAPQNAAPLSGRGKAQLALGRPHAASRDFTRAAVVDARFAPAYRNRAEARLETGNIEEAIQDFSRAIAFDTTNAEVLVLRGHAYLASDNTASAIKDFARAVEIEPRSAAGYQSRGLAHGFAEAFDDAYADLNKAIEIDPRSALAFAYRAYVYKLNGQTEIGLRDVQTAMKLDPALAEAYWAKGEIEEAAGRTDQAMDDFRKAVEMKPSLRLAQRALERVGGGPDSKGDTLIAGSAVGPWRIVARAGKHFAVSTETAKLRIPLEMAGQGVPQLLDWELRPPPLKGIGVLRFAGGTVEGPTGPEETELAAIVDLVAGTVVGIQPHRQGSKVAGWTWDEGKVTVASVDGVTDEFVLRTVRPADTPVAAVQRRSGEGASSGWSPWDQSYGINTGGGGESRRQAARPSPQKKPKTLFDLLFKF